MFVVYYASGTSIAKFPDTGTLITKKLKDQGELYLYPPQTVFVGGYTVFTLSDRLSVHPSVRPTDRVSVTFCFRNYFKNHGWNFIKFCKHIHMYKANTNNKKLRARGQYYWSF